MAAQSKLRSLQPSKPKAANKKTTKPELPEGFVEHKEFWCCRCGKTFKAQSKNFSKSQSTLYFGNLGYLPICTNCVDKLFEHYKSTMGDDREAMRRVCQKFDIYWSEDLYKFLDELPTSTSRIRGYITRANTYSNMGKTYDDTLDEEKIAAEKEAEERAEREKEEAERKLYEEFLNKNNTESDLSDYVNDRVEQSISASVIEFWGSGLPNEMYKELEARYSFWLSKYPDGTALDPGEEALLRQVCSLEIEINHARADGKPTDKLVNNLNNYIGSLNLKPSQKKETTDDGYIPFGVEIAKWEEERPVITPDPEFSDVDGIKRKVTAWFLGQLCRMVGIKNKYSDVYDEEMAKWSVERPNFEEDDDEGSFDDVFGKNLISSGGDNNA